MLEKPRTLEAALFDFDGTIADTEALGLKLIGRVLHEHGVDATEEELLGMVGNDDAVTVPPILARTGAAYTMEEYFRDLSVREVYYTDPIEPFAGAVAFIEGMREQGVRTAVVSSTNAHNVLMALNRLGMTRLFDAVVCGDMADRLKPHPDLYLRVLGVLGVEAGKCIAFEDSPSGISAAHAAGVYTVGFAGGSIVQDLSSADEIISAW